MVGPRAQGVIRHNWESHSEEAFPSSKRKGALLLGRKTEEQQGRALPPFVHFALGDVIGYPIRSYSRYE
jgi:hypothetical protein